MGETDGSGMRPAAVAAGRLGEGRTLQQKVHAALREAIVTGRFVPGRPVTLRGVAEELGVSPMPVREALRQLVAERALAMLDNRRVAVPEMSPARFDELCLARALLEPELAARALPNVDASLVQRLRALDAEVDAALGRGDAETYMRRNHGFHFELYRAATSAVLLPMVESLWLQVGPFLRVVVGRLGTGRVAVDNHQAAIEALRRRDEAALRAAVRADVLDGQALIAREIPPPAAPRPHRRGAGAPGLDVR